MGEKNRMMRLAKSPFLFRLFLLKKLPAAFFSGIRIKEINNEKCITSVPFKWFTQNPFHSTYFASLAMAAEMSTGVLAWLNTYRKIPAISMLVTKMEAQYFKKATGTIYFTCIQGPEITNIMNKAVVSSIPQTICVKTTGKNKQNELIAEFLFTWSFKAR